MVFSKQIVMLLQAIFPPETKHWLCFASDGRAMRYAWNGNHIQAVDPEVLLNGATGMGNLRAKLRHFKVSLRMPSCQKLDAVSITVSISAFQSYLHA